MELLVSNCQPRVGQAAFDEQEFAFARERLSLMDRCRHSASSFSGLFQVARHVHRRGVILAEAFRNHLEVAQWFKFSFILRSSSSRRLRREAVHPDHAQAVRATGDPLGFVIGFELEGN